MAIYLLWNLVVILFFYFESVDSLCTFPCSVQVSEKYESRLGKFEFSCKNSSSLIRCRGKRREIQECYERSGPFTLLRRKGNEYQCVKEADVHGKITWIYETPFRKYNQAPTMCSICSPALMKPIPYVVQGLNLKCIRKLKPPPIGCNIPQNCPVIDKDDVPCTGCEPVDDGRCCVGCEPPLQVSASASASAVAYSSPLLHDSVSPALLEQELSWLKK